MNVASVCVLALSVQLGVSYSMQIVCIYATSENQTKVTTKQSLNASANIIVMIIAAAAAAAATHLRYIPNLFLDQSKYSHRQII